MTRRSRTALARKALKALVFRKFPWMLAHRCGSIALYMKKIPTDGDVLEPSDAIYPDGTMPPADKPATCYSCKEMLYHKDLDMENFKRVQ